MTSPRKTATYVSSADPAAAIRETADITLKVPPLSSLYTEQAVLGALILSPSRAMGEVLEIFKELNPFYKVEHALVYESLRDMYHNSEPMTSTASR